MRFLRGATAVSGLLTLLVIGGAAMEGRGEDLGAWIVRQKPIDVPWAIIDAEQIETGTTIPPDTNVVLYLPSTFTRITREVLLGQMGDRVRYWGFCLTDGNEEGLVARSQGIPGLLFLSEAERKARAEAEKKSEKVFTLNNLPTRQDIIAANAPAKRAIRHQLEIFRAEMICYIMTSEALAIGLDPDADLLNNKREHDEATDPANPDTDIDGIGDGIEVMTFTDPARSDTDGDYLVDGLEDQNFNGKLDQGETNPRKGDTDGDGLADGQKRMQVGRREYIFYGEDNNLNGKLDEDEYNPTKVDSNGNNVTDYQEFFNCLIGETEFCL